MIETFLGPWVRKGIAAALGGWAATLIERGLLTQPQFETVSEAILIAVLLAATLGYTWIKNKITGKVRVVVPKKAEAEVKAIARVTK